MRQINFLLTFSLVILIFLISCNGKNKTATNSSDIPDVLKNEGLLKTHEYKVLDTTDNGNPQVVRFYDKSDEEIAIEKKYYNSGNLFMEGPLKNGKRNGKWIAWYENGVMWSTGHYKEGIKDGLEEAYYENGTLRYSKNFINNSAEGLAKYYDIDGKLVTELMFENNEIVSEKQYGE